MRVLVSIFAGFLILISLYQLSFTWFVNQHEKSIVAQAEQYISTNYDAAAVKYPDSKEAQSLYQDSLNLIKKNYYDSLLDASKEDKITWWGHTYQKAKEKELLLGLDLQGGMNVTMDVALDGLIKGLSNNPVDPRLVSTIQEADQLKLTSDQNYITLFDQAFKKLYPNEKLAPLFANPNRNLNANASNEDVIKYIRSQADAAMSQTYQVLRKRIDKFGVANPNISLDENKGIITVELAGASDPERVRNYLQSTANLQFWEVYTLADNAIQVGFQNADKALETILYGNEIAAKDSIAKANNLSDSAKAIADSIFLAERANPLMRILQPAIPTADERGNPHFAGFIGSSLIKDTARVNAYLKLPAVKNAFPANAKFLWGKQERDFNGNLLPYLNLYAIKTIPGKLTAELEGNAIEDAAQQFDQITNEVGVSMTMTKAGAKVWSRMTERNIGKPIAIVLDDIVYTAPTVNDKIDGGQSRITLGRGGKDKNTAVEEANDIANILKSGKLDAPAKIVQEQVVGPTLGEEAIKGGILSFSISFGVIFLLMIVYYNTGGIVANIALILNLVLTFGILSSLNATLTAAGIAGLVLTIGMAVDTNVLIFERIKDELTHGHNHEKAVQLGYRRSLAPVLDGHITSLLTAIILFIYGLGPVLGFATTQIIGLLLSIFCGIVISRLVTDFYMRNGKHLTYFTSLSKKIFAHPQYNFTKMRKTAYIISGLVCALGIASFFNGFNQGVEFSGGRAYIVNFHAPAPQEQIREKLTAVFDNKTPVLKTYGSNQKLEITTDYKINEGGLATDEAVLKTLYEGLREFYPAGLTFEEFSTTRYVEGTKKVDPTISDDLKTGASWATLWSVILITLYIFIRFRDMRFSIGTIISLIHDALVTLAVFSFLRNVMPFSLEIDQHFIAAILTVIGFSMNDTVVVYDRIREIAGKTPNMNKEELVNKAINDTLSRTIMTSVTVFLTVLILFIVGGEVTRGFAFAMLVGVISGTYSSIFVAAPIIVDFMKDKPLEGFKHKA